MYTNQMQESKLRQAELIREADHYRLIQSLRKNQTSKAKAARILRGLATMLSFS
jgi:transcriptional regulator with GAF, ATPase, and Fis domain